MPLPGNLNMYIAPQILLLLSISVIYALMLRCYRRQDAMEESFLCSILLGITCLFVPDAIALVPFFWWGFHTLWANNLRMYLASMLGLLSVALYASISAFLWPDSWMVATITMLWQSEFSRSFCLSMPLWFLISSGIAAFLGMWYLAAHLLKFARANVRIQTRALLCLPVVLISTLSCLFPPAGGTCLFSLLCLSSGYVTILHWITYGLPKIRLPKRKERRGKMNRRSVYSRPSLFSQMLTSIRARKSRRSMRRRSYGRRGWFRRSRY